MRESFCLIVEPPRLIDEAFCLDGQPKRLMPEAADTQR
jgi:hypothetical protein